MLAYFFLFCQNVLTNIINCSFSSTEVPLLPKEALVTPLAKLPLETEV